MSRDRAEQDPAAVLLARHIRVLPGQTAVTMNAGAVTPSILPALSSASLLVIADRNAARIDVATRALKNTSFSGDVEIIAGHGAAALRTRAESRDFADVIAIRIPREKLALLQLLHDAFDALRVGGRCYIAGATNEGIRSADRLMHELFGNSEVLARDSSHRIIAASKRAGAPADLANYTSAFLDPETFNEIEVDMRGIAFTMFTRPGVFSWEHADEATIALAGVMQIERGQDVLDIGCGAGALGIVASSLSGGGRVCMTDVDTEAVRCGRRTALHANAHVDVMLSDVASAVIDQRFDVVVTNPPFHAGKATDLLLPQRFIDDAWTVLAPQGRLYLVANRTLPYERYIAQKFGNIATAYEDSRFKVLTAMR
jgi:16S rRNA (guanine1207-N2)-methyltransferase